MKTLHNRISESEILTKIRSLPVYRWSYLKEPNETHIGPVAEDFYESFHLGNSDKHIAGLDLGGVVLGGIRALAEENKALKNEVNQLKDLVSELLERVEALESMR